MIFDRIIEGGCSRRRPDVFIECGTHSVIVECDEKQHRSYLQTCENRRTMELFTDLGNRPVVMIRFNPDSYDGKRNGSFREDILESSERVLTALPEWKRRCSVLRDTLERALVTVPTREVDEIRLFFDIEYSESKQ